MLRHVTWSACSLRDPTGSGIITIIPTGNPYPPPPLRDAKIRYFRSFILFRIADDMAMPARESIVVDDKLEEKASLSKERKIKIQKKKNTASEGCSMDDD